MLKDLISSNEKNKASDESENFDLDKFLGPKPSIPKSKPKPKDKNEIKNSMDISIEAEAETHLHTKKLNSILAKIDDDMAPMPRTFMKHQREFKTIVNSIKNIQADPSLRKPDEVKKKYLQEPSKGPHIEKRVKKEFPIDVGDKEKTAAVFDALSKREELPKIKKIAEIPSYHHSPLSKSKLNPFEDDIKAKEQQRKQENAKTGEKVKNKGTGKSASVLESNRPLNKKDVMTIDEKLKASKQEVEQSKQKQTKEPADADKIRREVEEQVRRELEMKYKAEIESLRAMVANKQKEEGRSNGETKNPAVNNQFGDSKVNKSYNPLEVGSFKPRKDLPVIQGETNKGVFAENERLEQQKPYDPLAPFSGYRKINDGNELENLLDSQAHGEEEEQGSLHSPSVERSEDSNESLPENERECQQSDISERDDEVLARLFNDDSDEVSD